MRAFKISNAFMLPPLDSQIPCTEPEVDESECRNRTGLLQSRGLSPAELTIANLDKSSLLEEVLSEKLDGHEDALLGELQVQIVSCHREVFDPCNLEAKIPVH